MKIFNKKSEEEKVEEEIISMVNEGRIYDRNGNIIADNKAVCSISVIHSQIEDEAEVTELLTRYLDKDPADIRK